MSKAPLESAEDVLAAQCGGETTAEGYVGDYHGTGHGAVENSQGYHDGAVTNFRAEHKPSDGRVMLSGRWRTDKDGVSSAEAQDVATLRYHARSVYAVLSVADPKKPARLEIQQDGKPLSQNEAGIDVRFDPQGSYIEVSNPRMYCLVRNPAFGSHLLMLYPQDKDLSVHSFTYGNNCQQNFEHK